jgi:hypothetical protein
MNRRHAVLRALAVGVVALVLGAGESLIKGGGAGLVGALSRTAAPWLLLAFLAGAYSSDRRLGVGAFVGLEATLLGLVGYYLINSLFFPVGANGWIVDLRFALQPGKIYFELGVVSGPLFGAFGVWWRQHLSMVPVIVLGLIFIIEAVEQASQVAFPQYAEQVAAIEIALGVLWMIVALTKTRLLRAKQRHPSPL